MFWVISHCYEVIFHLWQSLSGRGEPVREGPELSVSRSDLSTFSVIHFLLWSRAREPSNLCPGPQMTRRRAAIFTLTHYPHQYFKVQARSPGSWHCWHSSPSSWLLTDSWLWPWPIRGPTLCFIGILSGERPSDKCQVTMSEWKKTIILYFAQEWDNYIQLNYLQNESCKLCFLFLLTRRHSVHRA